MDIDLDNFKVPCLLGESRNCNCGNAPISRLVVLDYLTDPRFHSRNSPTTTQGLEQAALRLFGTNGWVRRINTIILGDVRASAAISSRCTEED